VGAYNCMYVCAFKNGGEVRSQCQLGSPPTVLCVRTGGTTVEPLYNGHFGTGHFWVIFAVIQRLSSFRGKNVLAWYHWDCKTCP